MELKSVVGHPNYRINNKGDIFSLKTNKILKWQFYKQGYPYIRLDGKSYLMHRLVAIHFISNPFNHPIVQHKDNDPRNPLFSNLEWSTQGENIRYAIKQGRKPFKGRIIPNLNPRYNERNPNFKFLNKEIEAMRFLYSIGYSCCEIRKLIPVSPQHFKKIVENKVRIF